MWEDWNNVLPDRTPPIRAQNKIDALV